MTRREQREAILSLLYEYTFYEGVSAAYFLSDKESFNEESLNGFVKESFTGCINANSEIDEAIKKYAVKWKLSRISRITKSILRLGVYELIFTDTPAKVIINEAVELSKKYGEDKSSGFVNGILNNLARGEGKISDLPADSEAEQSSKGSDGNAETVKKDDK